MSMLSGLDRFARELTLATAATSRQPQVVVIEPAGAIRSEICRYLHQRGCAGIPAAAPLNALRILDRGAPVDGAVLGPSWQGSRGRDLASFLTETYPGLLVLMVDAEPPRAPSARQAPRWHGVDLLPRALAIA